MSNLDLIKQNINNKLKFVIPIELYKDESYNKLRRSIILLISELIYKFNNINEVLNELKKKF